MSRALLAANGLLRLSLLTAFAASQAVAAEPPLHAPKPPLIELVRDGQAQAVMALPDGAALELRHAAKELTDYVRIMSGAELKTVTGPVQGPAVVIEVEPGLNPVAEGQRSWVGGHGYRIRTEGQTIRIAGADPLGALHGTYALLERHLGVRWLWPGELGEVVPRQKTVRVGQIDETATPAFPVRWVGSGPWALRQRCNVALTIGSKPVGVKWRWSFHTFQALIPAKKYYEAHPEWWPLVDGKRQEPTEAYSHSTQLCTTNAEMIAEMTRNLIAVLDKEPDIEIIALSPNDGDGFCECEKCRALDEPGQGWFGKYSKRLAVLNNAVAREVQKKHPRVLIKVGAYAMYLRRPSDADLAPTENQIVQICHISCCHSHPIEGDHCVAGKTFKPRADFLPNQTFDEIARDWKKVTKHLFVYEYCTLALPDQHTLPWPMVHCLREDMPYYKRLGVEGFFTQVSGHNVHRNGMNYYVAAKLAWDTTLDVDAIMADFCHNAFGPAAEPMLAYFRRMEQAMVDANICISYGQEHPARWAPKVFTEAVLAEAAALLDRAEALAASDEHRGRVAMFKRGYDEACQSLAKVRPTAR